MCRDLELDVKTCNSLKYKQGGITVDQIAVKYVDESPRACWEKIIHHLCEDFGNKRLAREVAKTYQIPDSEYSKNCPVSS